MKKISSDSSKTVLPQILPEKSKLKEFSYKKTRLLLIKKKNYADYE